MARKTTTTKSSTKTTKKATTTSRSKAPAKAPAKPAAKAAKPAATKLDTPEVVSTLGKRELIDRVVTASGIKKKAAKPVVEAMLRELGDALSRGDTLNLQPFGKGIVKTRKSLENAEVVELRLRRSRQAMAPASEGPSEDAPAQVDAPSTDPLAEAAE